jgi:YVTN family beta-propeller protein
MKLTSTFALAVLAVVAMVPALHAQGTTAGHLLVLSKGDLTLSVVDPATLKVLGRVPSGPDPHEVIASTDGRTAYIANYNGGDHLITVVDLVAMTALAPIDLGNLRAPHGLDFAAGKLWFTAERSNVLGSYDPAAHKVDWTLDSGQNGTHMISVSPDARRIVTSNIAAGSMLIAERSVSGEWTKTVVPTGPRVEGFDLSPDGKEIWAANAGNGTVSVIDLATKRVTQTIDANVAGANRLKFTPDGRHVLISTLSGSDLTILDAASRREVKRLPVGRAAGIQIEPNGARAFIACTPEDHVAIVDLKSLTIAGRLDAGRQPDGMAWAPAVK